MVLTESGQILLERALLIDMHYRQAQEAISALDKGIAAEFRVAAGSAYHASIGPDMIRQLRKEFPRTQFGLSFEVVGLAIPKLIDGELDLLLGAFEGKMNEGIETRPLMNVEMTVYACKTNPLALLDRVEPHHLRGKEWVLYQRDRLTAERINFYCQDHLLPTPSLALEIDSLVASFNVVRGTEFVTPATNMMETMADSAGLARLNMSKPLWRFQSGACFRRSMRDNPILLKALAIIEELVEPQRHYSRPE